MMKVARVTLSDRASAGIYEDLSGPRIEEVFAADWTGAIEWRRLLLRDERSVLEATLRRLCDEEGCALILTTGGTGPAPRDITPEATRAVLERELPGFGEIMRTRSFATVPTAILSRALAGTGIKFAGSQVDVIGDTGHDIACGKAFGARTIAVATGSWSRKQLAEHEPDFLFDDLSNVDEVRRTLGW